MYKGFNQKTFMTYLKDNFSAMDSHFTCDIVENIINYAHKHESISKDQFCYFVADMIPEVEMLEVARFCEDGKLTDGTLKELGRL